MPFVRAASVLVLVSVTVAGCSGGNEPSPPPAPAALQVSCPAPVSAESLSGAARTVDFPAATTTGGTAPVTTTCAPASGSTFQVGTTPVKCTAVDAKQQQASCDFNVTVTRPGNLSATRFLAFGDSITFGSLSQCNDPLPVTMSIREALRLDAVRLRPRDTPPSTAYPNVLLQRLAARYTSQTISVVNSGNPGEFVTAGDPPGTNDETLSRLRSALSSSGAQVLLLMEGTNDLVSFNHHTEPLPSVTKAYGDMLREARARGAQVFLGTMLPYVRGTCRGDWAWDLAVPMNDQIKSFAAAEGLPLVDLYQAFGSSPGANMGPDGLHPSVQGYDKIAETFFNVIRERLEVPR